LAEALGISAEAGQKASNVVYSEELVNFARIDGKFLSIVEKAFAG
jgi:hypothetical protein